MARKAKKRMHKMPALSFLDKTIYWFAFLFLFAANLFLLLGSFRLRHTIAFADESVIAVEDNISAFWLAVPCMTLLLLSFIPLGQRYQDRYPLFGRRNLKYGPPAWPKVYPLFMKNKPYVFVSERKKKEQKQYAIFLLIVLLVSFIPLPWSFYGRDCLRSDGSIVQYNMFDRQVHDFSSREISEVKIETYRYSTGKNNLDKHWGVQMEFITKSGKKYAFELREFRKGLQSDSLYCLETMTKVKNRYDPSIIHYDDTEKLNLVAADMNLTDTETTMLYRLFGQK